MENFSWAKFFQGFTNPINLAKAFVTGAHLTIIIFFASCVIFTGVFFFNKIKKPKAAPQPVTITTTSGAVHNSNDEVKSKWSIIGIF